MRRWVIAVSVWTKLRILPLIPRYAQPVAANGLLFGSMHLIHGTMDGNWPHAVVLVMLGAGRRSEWQRAY
jgi:hypothetical protein